MAETNLTEFPRKVPLDEARIATADAREQRKTRSTARTFARSIWMVLLTGAVVFAGYKGQQYLVATKPEPPKRPPQEKVSFVKSVPVVFADYQPMLRLYGETVAGRRVELRALVAGDVTAVGDGLRDGGEVKAGDPLLTINPFNYKGAVVETGAELAAARGRLTELRASLKSERDGLERDKEQLQIAVKDVQRMTALVKRNAVSARLLDERELVLSQRRQVVEQRENNIKVQAARITQQDATITRLTWTLEQAKQRLTETNLSAPFNAYVTDVNADMGRMLVASDRVATLLDRDWIEARFVLTDKQYGRIVAAAKDAGGNLIGRPVKVIWRVGDAPISYDATIARIGATIASGQGGVTIIARLKTPSEPIPIRPGAFVEVESPDRKYNAVARLPQTAVYDNRTVYVIKDERLQSRTVEVIGADGSFVLVRGEKLQAGDRIATTRLSTVGDGLKVEELNE